jgi:hypothetical protein
MGKEFTPQDSQIVLYASPDGQVKVEVFLQNETVWLTQKRMADIFGVEVNTINYHIKEIFKSGELVEKATIRKFRIVQKEGLREVEREPDFYNLDMIISVGYRVNSQQATKFRIWATRVLSSFCMLFLNFLKALFTKLEVSFTYLRLLKTKYTQLYAIYLRINAYFPIITTPLP